jgi:PLP dependent protein
LAEQKESASAPTPVRQHGSYPNRTRGVSADAIRSSYERIRKELGPDVAIVAATKYVGIDELGALAEAGVEIVGENRAQDLEAKHARYGEAFQWHFIGHLQSRKAKTVNELCELCHSLASESAAKRLTIPALVEVNLSGEPTKSGIPEDALEDFLALYENVVGLMTMPPATSNPEDSRPYFRRLRELGERYGLRELSMGTSQDYRVAADEGATMVRLGSVLYQG